MPRRSRERAGSKDTPYSSAWYRRAGELERRRGNWGSKTERSVKWWLALELLDEAALYFGRAPAEARQLAYPPQTSFRMNSIVRRWRRWFLVVTGVHERALCHGAATWLFITIHSQKSVLLFFLYFWLGSSLWKDTPESKIVALAFINHSFLNILQLSTRLTPAARTLNAVLGISSPPPFRRFLLACLWCCKLVERDYRSTTTHGSL